MVFKLAPGVLNLKSVGVLILQPILLGAFHFMTAALENASYRPPLPPNITPIEMTQYIAIQSACNRGYFCVCWLCGCISGHACSLPQREGKGNRGQPGVYKRSQVSSHHGAQTSSPVHSWSLSWQPPSKLSPTELAFVLVLLKCQTYSVWHQGRLSLGIHL